MSLIATRRFSFALCGADRTLFIRVS